MIWSYSVFTYSHDLSAEGCQFILYFISSVIEHLFRTIVYFSCFSWSSVDSSYDLYPPKKQRKKKRYEVSIYRRKLSNELKMYPINNLFIIKYRKYIFKNWSFIFDSNQTGLQKENSLRFFHLIVCETNRKNK